MAHYHHATTLCPTRITSGIESNVIKYVTVLLVVLSIALNDHFLDLMDVTEAFCITMSCILLPIIFYLKQW